MTAVESKNCTSPVNFTPQVHERVKSIKMAMHTLFLIKAENHRKVAALASSTMGIGVGITERNMGPVSSASKFRCQSFRFPKALLRTPQFPSRGVG